MKLQINNARIGAPGSSLRAERATEALQCYLMLATQIIGFLVLTIYPILWTFKWAWFSYNGIPSQTYFVGWQNFITMFTTDTTYWKVWGNTLLYSALKVPVELTLALVLALLLSQKIRGSGFFRVVYFLPNIISPVIIGLIFINMFSYWGVINATLMKLHIISAEIDWFAKKSTAMAVLVTAGIWNTFGINLMFFLAALTNVPRELYECAQLDGASKTRMLFSITLPMITSVFKIIVLLAIIGTLSVNEFVLVLTNGAPSGQTNTVMSYLTRQFVPGFTESTTPALGYGCAMSLVTTLLFAVVAVLYNQMNKKVKPIN